MKRYVKQEAKPAAKPTHGRAKPSRQPKPAVKPKHGNAEGKKVAEVQIKKSGRPLGFKPAFAEAICAQLAAGVNLNQICRMPGMPSRASVYRWLHHESPECVEFRDTYARAREAYVDYLADELLDICDDSRNDWMERELADGVTIRVVNMESIRRSALRCDTRKWLLARLAPRKYGDSTMLKIANQTGEIPAVVHIIGHFDAPQPVK